MNNEQNGKALPEGREFLCKFSGTSSPCTNPDGETEALAICEICRSPMCSHHISESDQNVCVGCFSDSALAAVYEPLIDEDGVTHKGRVIKPFGFTYKTLMQRLIDYTEDELITHIHHVKEQIAEAERILDYRRLDMSASTCELEDRQIVKRKKLRFKGVTAIAGGAGKSVAGPKLPDKNDKQLKSVANRLKMISTLLGLPCKTAEDLTKVAMAVKAMGEQKAKSDRVAAQQAAQTKPSATAGTETIQ